ncbi:MAG: GNAT family N-acetyltransferase [Nocardioidaceae bacterium]
MPTDCTSRTLLARLERYYDAVPRPRSRMEEVGPFTLFVADAGWPFYARPRLGETAPATVDDVRRVLARQQEIGVPRAIEWVDETTPGLLEVVKDAGVQVEECPLLVLEGAPTGEAGSARMLDSTEETLLLLSRAAVHVGFGNGGTARGEASIAERDSMAASGPATLDPTMRARLQTGEHRAAAVFAPAEPELGPVGGGGYSPVDGTAEIAGVAVLPSFRRQGLAAQVSYVLAADAVERGATTVFCSAQTAAVARVYEGVGFRRVGTACIAEVPD